VGDIEEGFYDPSPPSKFQQGDLISYVPIITLPPSGKLVVARTAPDRERILIPNPGIFEAFDEDSIDSFVPGKPEHIFVSAEKGAAMIVTQTCDLDRGPDWLICPIKELAGSGVQRGNLFDNRYETILGLPAIAEKSMPDCLVDLRHLLPARQEALNLADRIASLGLGALELLGSKLARMLSRRWGYEPGEIVPKAGRYRCNTCNNYDIPQSTVMLLSEGSNFPDCSSCLGIHKRAAWYSLRKHRP
jgi:hypothetical protein